MTSSSAALSRTDRVSAWATSSPDIASPAGAQVDRPRVGLSPTSPVHDAGIRIEPAPSLPCAAGTMPEATAAADPPDEPPTVRSSAQGLRVGPKSRARSSSGSRTRVCSPSRRRRAGSKVASDELRIGRGDPIAQGHRPLGLARAGGSCTGVLQEEGHARKGGARRRHESRGLRPRSIEERRDDRVQARVEGLDPLDCGIDQLGRRDLAPANQVGLADGVEAAELRRGPAVHQPRSTAIDNSYRDWAGGRAISQGPAFSQAAASIHQLGLDAGPPIPAAWMKYQMNPTTNTMITNMTPELFRYASASARLDRLVDRRDAREPVQDEREDEPDRPEVGQPADVRRVLDKVGRVRRASSALTPGMIQLSEDARIVNHAEAARLSLPSRAGSALGASAPSPTPSEPGRPTGGGRARRWQES